VAAISDVAIRLASGKKEADEISRLASGTGSEEHEIDKMISSDRVFVAKRTGKTIGFIALKTTKEGNAVEISGLSTKEHERRKGVAKLLVEHAEKLARSMNAAKLIVRTGNDNIPALALYQQSGFKISGVKLGALVEHHGGREVIGWQGIPARDEVTLEKAL